MDPSPDTHLDAATAARQVSLCFDQWFAAHHLDLPAETRAEFVQMGVEALQRWPDRSTGDVLEELIAELDARLDRIVDEAGAAHTTRDEATRAAGRPGWL